MQSAFIVNDRSGKPYALVALLNGGTEFYPITENARSWSGWMKDEFAAKKITREELIATLDNSMQVEGPLAANRINKVKFDELLKKAKKPAQVVAIETAKVPEEKTLVPVISLVDVYLSDLEDDDWRNAVNFKAKSFIADSNKSTYGYEVKRTRAVWDDSLSIPGTDRRGGWRCPVGTRYGGQITDRFGRNCGWGVARRLANAITNIGERIEDADDKRRGRRVARRNERMVRRLQQGGRLERAARGVANALETGDQPSPRQIEAPRQPRGAGLVERAAGRIGRALDTPQRPRQQRNRRGPAAPRNPSTGLERGGQGVIPRGGRYPGDLPEAPRDEQVGIFERLARQVAEGLETDGDNVPSRRPAPNRRPAAPRAPQARPARPRQPRQPRPNQPRQPRPVDTVSRTPVPAGAPNPGESLDAYKRRKYNEHQANVRKIREQGGNAGFLRYNEWEAFHGPVVEENWRRANPNAPSAPQPPAAPQGRFDDVAEVMRVINEGNLRDLNDDELQQLNAAAQRFNDEGAFIAEPQVEKVRREVARRQRNAAPRRPRQPAGRNNRRVATEANAGRTATRRPTPNDVPDANQPSRPSRQRPRTQTPAEVPAVNNEPPSTPPIRPLNKAQDRHDTKMPRLADENGRVRRVPVGNAGIQNVEQAKRYSGSINDIPDEFLEEAIKARSVHLDSLTGNALPPHAQGQIRGSQFRERIKMARLTGGETLTPEDKEYLKGLRESGTDFFAVGGWSVSNPTFYMRINEDGSIDGRGYLLKPEDRLMAGRGQHAELVGIEIARRMGFAQGMPRVMKKGNKTSFLLELGPNMAEGHAVDFQRRGVDRQSRLGHFLVNMIVGATDRHEQNGMRFVDNGALPIDFGRAFVVRQGGDQTPQRMANYVDAFIQLDTDPLKAYKTLSQRGLSEAEIKAEIKRDLTAWKTQVQQMFDDGTYDGFQSLVANADTGYEGAMRIADRKQFLQDRIALLDSDEFIDALWLKGR